MRGARQEYYVGRQARHLLRRPASTSKPDEKPDLARGTRSSRVMAPFRTETGKRKPSEKRPRPTQAGLSCGVEGSRRESQCQCQCVTRPVEAAKGAQAEEPTTKNTLMPNNSGSYGVRLEWGSELSQPISEGWVWQGCA